MMEHLDVRLSFYIKRFVHCAPMNKDRHIAVQNIDFLMGIRDHCPGCPNAGDADDDAACKEKGTYNQHQLDFVFKILNYHNIPY